MDEIMRTHADAIVKASVRAVQPDEAVSRALQGQEFPGRVVLADGADLGAVGAVRGLESSITNPLMVSRSSIDSSESTFEDSSHSEAELLI